MFRTAGMAALSLLIAGSSSAEGASDAVFLWAREPGVANAFRASLGIGALDNSLASSGGQWTSRGVVFTSHLGADLAIAPDILLSAGLPMAGTLSGGPDDFGIGNIVVGVKYVAALDTVRLIFGADVALPSASRRSAVGRLTRHFVRFVPDQTAISPYFGAALSRDRFTLTADIGSDLQIFSTKPALMDRVEALLSFNAGVSYAVWENLRASIEFGGFSSLSYPENTTQVFAGAGVTLLDHKMTLGLHVWAPFTSEAKDVIDVSVTADLRVPF